MSERSDPPLSDARIDQRSKRRLARSGISQSIARQDSADQPAFVLLPIPPPSSSATASEGEDNEDAPVTIAACVAEPTLSGEVAKRARASSSSGSDGQEDKRLRLCEPHGVPLPPPPEYTETLRSLSPAERTPLRVFVPLPPVPAAAGTTERLRHEAPAPASPPRIATPPALPPSQFADHATTTSRLHSMRSEQQSTSWPKDSTSYATLASPVSRDVPMETSHATSPQPSTSYAAAASAPASPRRSPPRTAPAAALASPHRSPSRAAPAAADPTGPAAPPQPTPRSAYPPIVVECLPNWTRHFDAIGRELGCAPNARPLGRGVRFLPRSADEFRAVQRYLTRAANQDSSISWFCYSPAAEVPVKVAIRGLPLDTPTAEVVAALRALGFPAEAARAIPAARGKHGCTYYVRLAHLTHEELRDIYAVTELLYMPQITVEAWRGGTKPPQCHRCQGFAHNSVNCHRAIRCVRCAGGHPVRDCARSRDDSPTCANCGKDHAANDRRCAVYKKEARRRGITIRPPPPQRAPAGADNHRQQQRGSTTAPAPTATPSAAHRDAPHAVEQLAHSTHPADAAPRTSTAPPPAPAPPTHPEEVRAEAPRGPTTLTPIANAPTERGAPLRRGKRRNRAPRLRRTSPAAASTPQPRQPRSARVAAAPAAAPSATPDAAPFAAPAAAPAGTSDAASEPTPTAAPATAHTAAAPTSTTGQGASRDARQSRTQPAPTEQRAQGEGQTNPDVMAIVRVVVEALMTGLSTYLQGQGAMAALTAGLAVLTRLQTC